MNILILGSGGRESAFASKIAESSLLSQIYIAPGNAGTSAYGKNINLNPTDFEGIADFVLKNQVKMVIVGPEEPLVKGIHDFFLNRPDLMHIPVIGPQMHGAQLEGSKDFSKQFMIKHGIPTAAFKSFNKSTLEEGLAYLETQKLPIVLKADGLAAGKGVLICETLQDAQTELKAMLGDAKFGEASSTVVIEEFLTGIELSVFVLTDGKSYKILPEAKDYKRIGEGDTGLNTGGMGSISPVSFADAEFMKKVEDRIIMPTIEGLKKDGIPYKGFIFIGLMASNNPQGREPYVIEYNVRMGDPETESVLPRIESDLLDLFLGVAHENLAEKELKISSKTAATVMIVAGGYPGDYAKGKEISGIENLRHSTAFHAGTILDNGLVKSNGGRVIAVTSLQDNLFDAVQCATADAGRIYFDGRYFRPDIGVDLMELK
ncbi:phosphoribosylamine--glycine ligase [Daejeonella sp.]|uniref:phosphoribosylamine--glycine ligase n=1 Tax=Daejeonella sp. TaxID=2805397 RepID=UPI0025BB74B3|nr:phosphoribosylamine--glycine ligase [Daejeonella sp.]